MPKPKQRRIGEPRVLDEETLRKVYLSGFLHRPITETGRYCEIPQRTVERWITQEDHPFTLMYRKGQRENGYAVARKLMEAVNAGNLTATIWWEKTRLGMHEEAKQVINVNANATGTGTGCNTLTPEQAQKVDSMAAYIRREAFKRTRDDLN